MAARPFVRRASESSWTTWDDTRNGVLAFTSTVGDGTTPSDTLTAGLARVPVGGWLGLHSHEATEIYHVLAGEGVVYLDGREEPIAGGSVVFIPSRCVHGVRNAGQVDLEFFYVYAADSADDERTRYSYPNDVADQPTN